MHDPRTSLIISPGWSRRSGRASVWSVDLVSGEYVAEPDLPVSVNGAGYNRSAVGNYQTGDVDPDGFLWITNGQAAPVWYKIDLRSGSSTFLQILATGQAATRAGVGSRSADWAYVPGHPGSLFFVSRLRSGQMGLERFDMATGTRSLVGPLDGLSPTYSFGAAFADADGFLYGSDNSTGDIVRVNVATRTAVVFAQGPASAVNDGARCSASVVPLDLGDAPDTYGTTIAGGGARHSLLDWSDDEAPLMLGASVTRETIRHADNGDLDDAFSTAPEVPVGAAVDRQVTVHNDSDNPARLLAWFDANRDGDFEDAGERIDGGQVPAN